MVTDIVQDSCVCRGVGRAAEPPGKCRSAVGLPELKEDRELMDGHLSKYQKRQEFRMNGGDSK